MLYLAICKTYVRLIGQSGDSDVIGYFRVRFDCVLWFIVCILIDFHC